MTDPAERLRAEGLAASPWSNGPGDRYGAHEHGYDKVIACTAGSIVFGLPELGREIAIEEGERLELPAGTRHDAQVGPRGVSCLEAHLAAGRLATARRLGAGEW